MIQRNNSKLMVLLVAVFGAAACGGDAADAASEAVAQEAPAEAAAEMPAEEGEMEAATEMQELPEGVTMAMVEEGKGLFGGAGICASCHAPDGSGVPNLGANLTDEEWVHSDGSFEGILATITAGVTADASTSGIPMPPKGGSAITDDQVKAVAAYVWTLDK